MQAERRRTGGLHGYYSSLAVLRSSTAGEHDGQTNWFYITCCLATANSVPDEQRGPLFSVD